MHRPNLLRRFLCAIALASSFLSLDAGTLAAADRDNETVAGQLLVAVPGMPDPRFAGTVVLIVRQDKDGALGIVINRPVQERALAEVLGLLGEATQGIEGTVQIFAGGPVQRGIGFVLHSDDYHQNATIQVAKGIDLTSSPSILQDIGHRKGPNKVLVAFGYAGWAPGQLEREMADHAWATTTADSNLVFDEDRSRLWDVAWARRSISL
jgi:putative transcriptional regulator